MEKPFSQASFNNSDPILSVLKRHVGDCSRLLEIGSGTGQHAVYFAPEFPSLIWQTSDLIENHAGIRLWLQEYHGRNIQPPIELNVTDSSWPILSVDTVYTANTLHIMSWPEAQACIEGAAKVITVGGYFVVYGPFNYEGRFTSDSNARFNEWLKAQAPHRAIRHFEDVVATAERAGLQLLEDNAMPANNRCLVFKKHEPKK